LASIFDFEAPWFRKRATNWKSKTTSVSADGVSMFFTNLVQFGSLTSENRRLVADQNWNFTIFSPLYKPAQRSPAKISEVGSYSLILKNWLRHRDKRCEI